jgi:hypothetical protein
MNAQDYDAELASTLRELAGLARDASNGILVDPARLAELLERLALDLECLDPPTEPQATPRTMCCGCGASIDLRAELLCPGCREAVGA